MRINCPTHGETEARVDSDADHLLEARCLACEDAAKLRAAAGDNAKPTSVTLRLPTDMPEWEKNLRTAIVFLGTFHLGNEGDWKTLVESSKMSLPRLVHSMVSELWRRKVPESVYTRLIRAQLNELAVRGAFSEKLTLVYVANTLALVETW